MSWGGSIVAPLAVGELSSVVFRNVLSPVVDVFRGALDGGLLGAAEEAVTDKFRTGKAQRGFAEIKKELEKFGSLDEPEDIENLINLLNKNATINGVPQMTAAQATKNPVLLAMEDTLKKQLRFS